MPPSSQVFFLDVAHVLFCSKSNNQAGVKVTVVNLVASNLVVCAIIVLLNNFVLCAVLCFLLPVSVLQCLVLAGGRPSVWGCETDRYPLFLRLFGRRREAPDDVIDLR